MKTIWEYWKKQIGDLCFVFFFFLYSFIYLFIEMQQLFCLQSESTSYVQKVERLKLHVQKQNWTMNEVWNEISLL